MSSKDGTNTGNLTADTKPTRTDLASHVMGNNSLQGNDQSSVRTQRQAQPEVKQKTDGLIEGLKKLDKDVRAKTDLGKGSRGGNP